MLDRPWFNHVLIWIMPLLYGLVARLTFGFSDGELGELFAIVGLAFISLVPMVMGFLTVFLLYRAKVRNFGVASMLIPIGVVTTGMVLAMVVYLEAAICVVTALPIAWVAAFMGGAAGFVFYRKKRHNGGVLQLSFVVLLPYLVAPLESLIERPVEIKTITNTLEFDAPVDIVWKNIASVDPIPESEVPDKWIYAIGFPKPISATLSHEGVGGVRTAIFQSNVTFHEIVSVWEPEKEIAFSIEADPEFIPATAFDRHIIVGGRFFDVLDGRYQLEQLPDGRTRLHLTSQHRLSTSFNAYAAWWSTRIMTEIQDSIMQALKRRCEREARRGDTPVAHVDHRPREAAPANRLLHSTSQIALPPATAERDSQSVRDVTKTQSKTGFHPARSAALDWPRGDAHRTETWLGAALERAGRAQIDVGPRVLARLGVSPMTDGSRITSRRETGPRGDALGQRNRACSEP